MTKKNSFLVNQIEFDRHLIEKLDCSAPRYTSYPTADCFNHNFSDAEYILALKNRIKSAQRNPLSIYVHIPFCNTICFYCACNKIITKDNNKADVYIDYLERELILISAVMDIKEQVRQIHFGGGSPTFLSTEQLTRLMALLHTYFEVMPDAEVSIEIDPRRITACRVKQLAKLGFNRISIGIQDLDFAVQKAIGRIQSEEETRSVIDSAREFGIQSISVDLIYGLPHQTVLGMQNSLRRVLSMSPDRLSLYNYAHLPEIFLPQRRIPQEALPSAQIKLDILQNSVRQLVDAGYVFIGMDHFAKPDDELSVALLQGRLQRNFQGYSTHAECDIIGIGVSSIGRLENIYAQNEKLLDDYYLSLDKGKLPISKGIILTTDDILRREIIHELMCCFSLSVSRIEQKFSIDFNAYFAVEIAQINYFADLGLLYFESGGLYIQPKGRFLIRNIAMIFDVRLRNRKNKVAKFSKTI